jgi:hypothetical protein
MDWVRFRESINWFSMVILGLACPDRYGEDVDLLP